MLVEEHCLSPEFADRPLSWRHSGFQVYRAESVEPDDTPALERLCACIGRAVFASTRVEYDPSAGAVRYRTAKGAQLRLDALEWIALVIQHIPNPGDHTHHYFGLPARPPPVPCLRTKIEALLPDRSEDPDPAPSWVDEDTHGSDPVWAD